MDRSLCLLLPPYTPIQERGELDGRTFWANQILAVIVQILVVLAIATNGCKRKTGVSASPR